MTTAPLREPEKRELTSSLGQLDATMIVIGSMIGSGIFITSAESARLIGAPGWLLAAWALAGLLTITGALCCAELAAMMPRAGGQYVFLREAYGPLFGFLFGWAIFLVVQTGTIAAVAVAFAKFTGVLVPAVATTSYLIRADSSRQRLRHQSLHGAACRRGCDSAPHLEQHARARARQAGAKHVHVCQNRGAHRPDRARSYARLECRPARRGAPGLVEFVGERLAARR